jgi:aryl-alcohol dehydrogenase-like predicted oxidoreductase
LRTRQLGSQGPGITVVGFGAWAVGGAGKWGWGPQSDDDSIAAIRRALDMGINWIDTAAVYGHGHSEEVVGRAVGGRSPGKDVYVFTKCGQNWYGAADGEASIDLRPESIRFECDQSLKRLGVERIDLFQFHWPDTATGTQIEDSWSAMVELIDQGKVRWGGVSNFDSALLDRCERERHVDSLQPPYSMLARTARNDVIPWCRQHGTGVIVYSPMQSGLLTGAFSRERVESLPRDDWRRRDDDFREPALTRNLQFVDRLKPIAQDLGTTLPALAVAWTLATPGVSGAIVGARRPDQVDGWLAAGDLELSDEVLARIDAAIDETGAGWDKD